MISDYMDLTASINSSPTEDIENETVFQFIEDTQLSATQIELQENYNIFLSLEQISEFINDLGINPYFLDYIASDIIYENFYS